MGELVMTDPFHHYRRPGPRQTCCYLVLPGRAVLRGGPLFYRLFFFLYRNDQNLILLSFILVVFAVDCMWRCRVKSWSRF